MRASVRARALCMGPHARLAWQSFLKRPSSQCGHCRITVLLVPLVS